MIGNKVDRKGFNGVEILTTFVCSLPRPSPSL